MKVTKKSKIDTLEYVLKILQDELKTMDDENTKERNFILWLQKNIIHLKVQVLHE